MNSVSFLWVFCAFVLAQSAGRPRKMFYSNLETAPSYMLGGGYYQNPAFGRNYYPSGSLSAVVTKDLVASNSFTGDQQYRPSLEDNETKEQYTEKNLVIDETITNKAPEFSTEEDTKGESNVKRKSNTKEESIANEESDTKQESNTQDESTTQRQIRPQNNQNKKTIRRQSRKPVKVEDDEEDSPWAFAKGGPSYTAFFPINISGGSGGFPQRSRNTANSQDDVPQAPLGSATAIANAFSTGKGGIATSRATSFGDPNLAAMFLRSGMGNIKGFQEY